MADPAVVQDASARAALEKLADIVTPPAVSFAPQTWGWGLLAAILLALAVWAVLRSIRRRRANLYRREALVELARIERAIATEGTRAEALMRVPPLLKRVALVAWPRSRVASLAQAQWVVFLEESGGGTGRSEPLARLLNDCEYRSPTEVSAMSADEARACTQTARRWIETHHVSA